MSNGFETLEDMSGMQMRASICDCKDCDNCNCDCNCDNGGDTGGECDPCDCNA